MVPKVRMDRWIVPSGSVRSRQATTVFLWMSKPQQCGYRTCLSGVPFRVAHERCEGNTRFACVLTERSGQQSSLRERTRISFLNGLNAPECHDLVSLAPWPSMTHFHPPPCPYRTSRFLP